MLSNGIRVKELSTCNFFFMSTIFSEKITLRIVLRFFDYHRLLQTKHTFAQNAINKRTLISQFFLHKRTTRCKAYADENSLSIFFSKYLLSSAQELMLRRISVL